MSAQLHKFIIEKENLMFIFSIKIKIKKEKAIKNTFSKHKMLGCNGLTLGIRLKGQSVKQNAFSP